MRRFLFLLMFVLVPAAVFALEAGESTEFARFGKVSLYRSSPHPSHVILFVSGDGGWNLGVVEMAKSLSALDALVLGLDITQYLKSVENSQEECIYAASDFELLSKSVQAKLGFPRYVAPIMVGYSSGATLVYAALVQAPPNTFRGAVSLGFSPFPA